MFAFNLCTISYGCDHMNQSEIEISQASFMIDRLVGALKYLNLASC